MLAADANPGSTIDFTGGLHGTIALSSLSYGLISGRSPEDWQRCGRGRSRTGLVLRLRLGKKHGKGCDHDNAAIVKDPIAHGQRANRSNPDLTRFLGQIEQRLSKLRVDTQPSMEFLKCRKECLAIASLSSHVR